MQIVTYLFLLLLPTQLGKHFFFPISYLSGVRIDYLAPTLYLTDILAFILIVLNARAVIRFLKGKWFLVFTALAILNVVFALERSIAAYKLLKILELISIFAIFYRNKFSPKLLLIAFAIGGSVELLLSILQFVNKHTLQGIFYFLGERYITLSLPDVAKASLFGVEILRPYGTFSHPNSMAGFYLLLYFFVLTMKQWNNGTMMYLKYFSLFIFSCIIFLTFSKIAIATFLVLNIIYLFGIRKQLDCLHCFIGRIVILIVVSAIFITTQGDVLGIDKRIQLMKDALTIISHSPILGVGVGNYLIAQHGFTIKYPIFFLQPVHNIFLLMFAEMGLIFGGFVLYSLYRFFKWQSSNRVIGPLLYCSTVLLLTGTFDHYWLTLQQNWLLLPVICGLLHQYRTRS